MSQAGGEKSAGNGADQLEVDDRVNVYDFVHAELRAASGIAHATALALLSEGYEPLQLHDALLYAQGMILQALEVMRI